MIVISTLEDANQQFLSGVIEFKVLQEIALVFTNICPLPERTHISHGYEISAGNITWLLQQPEAALYFGELFGGAVKICQVDADLKQIVMEGVDMTQQISSWDVCNFIVGETNAAPTWAMVVNIENNLGGNLYFVPLQLFEKSQMAEHIAATDLFWKRE